MLNTKFTIPDNSFPHLGKYAAFLLEHCLDEAAEANIAMARQVDLPLLSLFAHMPEDQFLVFVKGNLDEFFQQLIAQNALEHAKEATCKWRKDTLPHVPGGSMATADLMLVYHVRRQLLLGFIDRYTTEVTEAVAIAKEVDVLYAQVERFVFSLWVELKAEEHEHILLELHEKNSELETTLEELQAAEEKLVSTKNELEERVAQRTKALVASQQQLRVITDSLPGLITYIDQDERYQFANKTYENWFAVTPSEIIGKKLEEVHEHRLGKILGAAAYEKVRTRIQGALQGKHQQYETTLITKTGELKHVLINYVPHLENGQVLGYYALATDISQRVEAEKALVASEQRFSSIFNQSSVGMAEVDLTGRFALVNDRYCQMVGRSREELYQMRMQDISHEKDVPRNMVQFQQAVQAGTPFVVEKRYERPNGTHIWVRNNVSVVKDTVGQPVAVVAICQDISERKEAEQALQESKDLFESFADNLQKLAWMTDPSGNVIWYNQRWYEYTGTTFKEMQDMGWLKVQHPDHIDRVLQHVNNALAKGESWELTFPIKGVHGAWGWFLTRAFAVRDAKGKIIRWIGTATDITELVKTQEQLERANEEILDLLQRETAALEEAQQQKERLYHLFMQAPSLLCINRGEEFTYELANPSYLEALMVDDSIIGKTVKAAFPDADPAIMELYSGVFKKGERFVGKELPISGDWKRDGKAYTRYFNLIYEPLRELDGTVSGIITFGYEVTEQVLIRQELEQNAILMQQMNQELNQRNGELSRINNDLDNFMYTASHDLRSPLLNLEGLHIALRKRLGGTLSPEAGKLLELTDKSIEKLKRTIKDLTEITKAQKEMDEVTEAVFFQDILEEIKSDLPERLESSEPFLQEDFQVTSIQYSKARLRSILYNLLSNAIKYKSEARPLKISVSTYKQEQFVVLTVEDNGLGITEQQLPKLFTMFTRLHTHVEGSGIGLYTIKRIIENAGGSIEVNTQLDKGSVFKVFLAQ